MGVGLGLSDGEGLTVRGEEVLRGRAVGSRLGLRDVTGREVGFRLGLGDGKAFTGIKVAFELGRTDTAREGDFEGKLGGLAEVVGRALGSREGRADVG